MAVKQSLTDERNLYLRSKNHIFKLRYYIQSKQNIVHIKILILSKNVLEPR